MQEDSLLRRLDKGLGTALVRGPSVQRECPTACPFGRDGYRDRCGSYQWQEGYEAPSLPPCITCSATRLQHCSHTQAELLKGTPSKPLPGGFPHGVKFESYILHAPDYLAHLASGLRSRGVPIIRRRLASLDEAYDLPEVGRVDLVVNALALGNKTLIGVEDDNMYPAQGQTVLVRAPLVNTCTMSTGDTVKSARTAANDDAIAYIIPRPGPDGHVVCGGTYNRDNWITQPSMAEAERILRACYALDPRLAGPNGTSWKDIEVVAHNVGLRPSRDGGVRLELEHRELVGAGEKSVALAPTSRSSQGHRQVAVVHAYGPGGTGYQSSIGLATKAADIVMGQVKNVPPRAKL